MKPPVRVSLLGNSFASRVQLPALRWAGDNRVVGIAGRSLAKARATAEEWKIPFHTDDWRALLERETDLVVVTTPVDLHHPMVLAALETGAAVLCEKPFTLDATEAAELVKRADERHKRADERHKRADERHKRADERHKRADGRGAWLDHELRWSPHLRELRRRLHGSPGEPRHAAVEMFLPPAGFRDRPWSWWYDARRGGGILGALGSHLVDLLRWLLGEVSEVRASLATFGLERADPDGVLHPVTADEYASLDLRFASGCIGTVDSSVGIPSERFMRLQVTCADETLRIVKGDELLVGPTDGELEPVPVIPPLPGCAELGLPEYGLFGRCLPFFLRDVLTAVREGRTVVEGAATFADGLATQRVLDAARRSAETRGGWIACKSGG